MGTITNLRERRRPPYDQDTAEVYTGPMSEYVISASLPVRVWGRIIASLEASPFADDTAAAVEVRTALSKFAHPSFQGGAS